MFQYYMLVLSFFIFQGVFAAEQTSVVKQVVLAGDRKVELYSILQSHDYIHCSLNKCSLCAKITDIWCSIPNNHRIAKLNQYFILSKITPNNSNLIKSNDINLDNIITSDKEKRFLNNPSSCEQTVSLLSENGQAAYGKQTDACCCILF